MSLLDKINKGREYRKMQMDLNIAGEDAGTYNVRGYATTFNEKYTLYEDNTIRIDEQVDPHAFDNCDMSDVIMQYNHEGRVFARLSNGTLKLNIVPVA